MQFCILLGGRGLILQTAAGDEKAASDDDMNGDASRPERRRQLRGVSVCDACVACLLYTSDAADE